MDKYTTAVLTVIALCVLALPVKAEEKVYYCEMTGLAKTDIDGDNVYQPQKFKFKLSPEKVVFGSGGWTDNYTLPIAWWGDYTMFSASDASVHMYFKKPELHYVTSNFEYTVAFSARCDDF